ncbi:hypothetical protein ACQJBY_042818 [Aegilops geniculata]
MHHLDLIRSGAAASAPSFLLNHLYLHYYCAHHQALPVQGQPGPSHHHPDVATMGGGSGQTNAPCGDIYVREGVVAVHHDKNLCCVDFRFFGDELDYIPQKAAYPAHERGYLKAILGE